MTVIDVALVLVTIAFAGGMIRIARGPTRADRAVAADVCYFSLISGLALLAIRDSADSFVDAVLVATLLGFIATISLAQLIGRGGEDR